MTALLVGADKLGNIPKVLQDHGYEKLIHWTGRKSSTRNKTIPLNVDLVLVFHDYVNHVLMDSIKTQAKERNLSILFSKRGVSALNTSLQMR